ncbi:RNA polymerase sigma-70 factor (ECF subfamily) [Rhizobium aquaticum]|uniref:RNA polymerase sigma-70 factor (ECF subfamily) n=1 Tax=Rhizobium aquaticum TaxID=1549636 RepID=A0ABV2IZ88_9HYPH
MGGEALEAAFREAGARIVAALAARFRDLDIAEEAFAEACSRAAKAWPASGTPDAPSAWLYRTSERAALDMVRRRKVRKTLIPEPPEPDATAEDLMSSDSAIIPEERLRLIFICCHPAVAPDSRAALTLRLVCGLEVAEIARVFLTNDVALQQRLVRAKRKIREAGVSFEVPGPEHWPERLSAVLSTLEVAYSKAHEDAAGSGRHAGFAAEMMALTALLASMMPDEAEVQALAAIIRFAEARRPARLAADGSMIPLSEQDPARWSADLIADARRYCGRALSIGSPAPRILNMMIHALWCGRKSLDDPPPWKAVLGAYDVLCDLQDNPIVTINRAVALAEVEGPEPALATIAKLEPERFANFLPFHALVADLLARTGNVAGAQAAFDRALALGPGEAERRYLAARRAALSGA